MIYVYRTIKFLFITYVAIGALLYFKQDSLIYHLTSEHIWRNLEEFRIKSEGENIKIFRTNQGHDRAILYFGGNNEIVGYNAETFEKLFPGYTIYLINYRGYGGSTGTPSERALYQDALNIYDYLKDDHSSISVIGRSLGTGVSTYLATKRDIEKMALVTPFDSIRNLAQATFPIYPADLLLKERYDSISRAPEITSEVLLVIAENDTLIPPVHGYRLSEAFREGTTTLTLPEVGHNTIGISKEYHNNLMAFFYQ